MRKIVRQQHQPTNSRNEMVESASKFQQDQKEFLVFLETCLQCSQNFDEIKKNMMRKSTTKAHFIHSARETGFIITYSFHTRTLHKTHGLMHSS